MSDILTHIDAGVMTLTFNRLDKKNSITGDMYAAMAQAVDQAQADAAIRVLVIQGHESIFSAGNDIGDFLNKPPSTVDSPVFHFMRALTMFEKPVIAAVAGPAVGIGTTLLFHCDLVYAADNAKFSMPFTQLGLCPEFSSSMLFPQIVGYPRAAEKLLLGEAFSAQEAYDMSLVSKVLPQADLLPYAYAQAAKLVALPPASLRLTKSLMKSAQSAAIASRMKEENKHFGAMLTAPEAREAFMAFFQKRKPDFSQFS